MGLSYGSIIWGRTNTLTGQHTSNTPLMFKSRFKLEECWLWCWWIFPRLRRFGGECLTIHSHLRFFLLCFLLFFFFSFFLFLFEEKIKSRSLIPLFMPGSVPSEQFWHGQGRPPSGMTGHSVSGLSHSVFLFLLLSAFASKALSLLTGSAMAVRKGPPSPPPPKSGGQSSFSLLLGYRLHTSVDAFPAGTSSKAIAHAVPQA